MRLKILALRRSFNNVIQARNYCGRPPRCDPHMNELPVPCIPWQPWYKDKQNLYNKILAVGVLWFLFSFGMVLWTDSIFLNWSPPKQPGPPSDFVEECDDSEDNI